MFSFGKCFFNTERLIVLECLGLFTWLVFRRYNFSFFMWLFMKGDYIFHHGSVFLVCCVCVCSFLFLFCFFVYHPFVRAFFSFPFFLVVVVGGLSHVFLFCTGFLLGITHLFPHNELVHLPYIAVATNTRAD